MASGGTPVLELESLFVRIFADTSQLNAVERQVVRSVNVMRVSLAAMATFAEVAFARFDDAITRTLAHMKDWQQEMRPALEGVLFDLASRSRTGVTDLTGAMDVMASRGIRSARALEIVNRFAVATGETATTSAKELTNLQSSLQLGTGSIENKLANLTRISDILVDLAPKVNTTVVELSHSLGGVFAVEMDRANMSLEQGAALMAMFAERGLKGAEAGTKATRVMQQLWKAGNESQIRMAMGNIAIFDAGKMRPLADIFTDMSKAFSTMSPQAQAAQLQLLGLAQGSRMSPVRMLLDTAASLRKWEEELKRAGGTTEAVAKMMEGTFTAQLERTKNNIYLVAIAIGQRLAPFLGFLADKIRLAADWFRNLNPAIKNLLVVATAIVALAPIITPLFHLLTGAVLAPFQLVFSTIGGIISLIVNPMAWLLAAIVAVGALLIDWDVALKEVGDLWEWITAQFMKFATATAGFLWNFQENWGKMTDWIKDNWKTAIADMLAILGPAMKVAALLINESFKHAFNVLAFDTNLKKGFIKRLDEALIEIGLISPEQVAARNKTSTVEDQREKLIAQQKKAMLWNEEVTRHDTAVQQILKGFDFQFRSGPLPDFNLKMPPDLTDKFAEMFQDLFHKQVEQGEPGLVPGRQGPGFTFKEMAEARYIFGGAVNESLDYQQLQVLRSIDNHLQQNTNAAREQHTLPVLK